tara:strand:- start:494 stop:922 length:429 start_codon:yes stop_codon:yes gene_type:complete
MSTSNIYTTGLNNVGSYQVSGTPYLTSSTPPQDTGDTSLRIQFPNVTRRITFKSTSNKDLRIHFAPYDAGDHDYSKGADANDNFFLLPTGGGDVVMDVKCKEVFITATTASATGTVYIMAELTNIPASRMFSLDNVEGVATS